MKVVLDSSVIVEIDRKNKDIVDIIKKLIEKNHDIIISTVIISEILAGSYLTKDFKKSVNEAKKILAQFLWIDLDSKIAEKTAQLIANLIIKGKMIDYPDIVIAATVFETNSDYILTMNKKHFDTFSGIKDKVLDPAEFEKSVKY